MATFYARFVVEGTTTTQTMAVQASSQREAKTLIENRAGRVKRWVISPSAKSKPPSWYKG